MVRDSVEPLGREENARQTGRSLARVAGRSLCWGWGVGPAASVESEDQGLTSPAKGCGHGAY